MELEEQVVSLGLAKQLKELGVKQDSLFYYCQLRDLETDYTDILMSGEISTKETNYSVAILCSAFTVAELGKMLPAALGCYNTFKGIEYRGIYTQTEVEIKVVWICTNEKYYAKARKEADARAKMLVYLLSSDCGCNDDSFLEWKKSILEEEK